MQRIFIFILLIYSLPGFSQKADNKIPYQEDRLLVWEDFRGDPDNGKPFHASTNSGISFSWSLETSEQGSEFDFEVVCSFHPDLSWVKDGSRSDHLLVHEQLHFDITELHARKFRKALEEYQVSTTIKEDLNRLHKKHEKDRQEMQRNFDAETRHSQNKEAQETWKNEIGRAMKEFSEFAL